MGNLAASVEGLTVSLGGKEILRDLNLAIRPGELVALVGASGAGKSTLLSALAGLTKPTRGTIQITGSSSVNTAIAFQEAVLLPWLNVRENIAFGFRFNKIRSAKNNVRLDIDSRVEQLMQKFGIRELADRKPRELSGGQAQRVGIARAALVEPNLLLLDEPFSAVDINTRKSLQVWLRSIVHELGLTAVLVTHDIDEAIAVGDRVLVLKQSGDDLVEYHTGSENPEDLKQQISYQI